MLLGKSTFPLGGEKNLSLLLLLKGQGRVRSILWSLFLTCGVGVGWGLLLTVLCACVSAPGQVTTCKSLFSPFTKCVSENPTQTISLGHKCVTS